MPGDKTIQDRQGSEVPGFLGCLADPTHKWTYRKCCASKVSFIDHFIKQLVVHILWILSPRGKNNISTCQSIHIFSPAHMLTLEENFIIGIANYCAVFNGFIPSFKTDSRLDVVLKALRDIIKVGIFLRSAGHTVIIRLNVIMCICF